LSSSIKPLKLFTFSGTTDYHSLERIGEYLIIATEHEIFYSQIDSEIQMNKYSLPAEFKKLNSAVAVSGENKLFLVDDSRFVKVLSFEKDDFLKVVKTFKLKASKHMHFRRVMTIQNIPKTSFYLTSADTNQIAKLDYLSGGITYFKQSIDYVLTLAISRSNLFLSSSDSGLLYLGEYTNNKTDGFVFNTKSFSS
jgi:hypothetical protein